MITNQNKKVDKLNLKLINRAKLTGQGPTTIYKVLKKELNYIPYNRLVKNVAKKGGNNESK